MRSLSCVDERSLSEKGTRRSFSVIFAYDECYCGAVIFGFSE